jgi:uncharacterized membrane protein YdjX (TVP38/TMEM64 family)
VRPRRLLLILFVLLLGVGLTTVSLPSGREAIADGVEWLRAAGPTGQIAALGIIAVGVPIGIPALFFGALLGYLYGVAVGLAIALTAIPLAATGTFAMSRWLFRDEVTALVERRPRWRALLRGVGGGGARVVILLRLAGPHNVLNLGLAATPLSLRSFMLGTLIGSAPSLTVATIGGALAPDAAALWENRESLTPATTALLVAGAVAFVLAVLLVRRAAKRALDREIRAAGG